MREIRGLIFTPDFEFKPGVLFIKDKIINKIEYFNNEKLTEEESKHYIIPGLVDIHMHGCYGEDVCTASAEGLRIIADYEKSIGVCSFCPATMTLPAKVIAKQLETISTSGISQIKGIYLEGPFISQKYKGAQDEKFIILPDLSIIRQLNEKALGMIKIVAIAPEEDGAIRTIEEGKEEFVFSLAHSNADYDTAMCAMEKGISQVTHIYNAMPCYHHREPGIIGAAMDNDKVMVEIIADGVHLHPSVIRNAFKTFGEDRIILISDSMEATGLEDGEYMLGGQKVFVNGNKARLSDGTIAGSVTNLYECLKYAISIGVKKETAIKAATYNPAKAIGMENEIGCICEGRHADIVILDEKLQIIEVLG